MSWHVKKMGRASKLAAVIKQTFRDTQCGGPAGSAEETAKNALGAVAEGLCASLFNDPVDPIVTIEASGSAWNEADGQKARHHRVNFSIETHTDFLG